MNFVKNFKNTFITDHLRVTASVWWIEDVSNKVKQKVREGIKTSQQLHNEAFRETERNKELFCLSVCFSAILPDWFFEFDSNEKIVIYSYKSWTCIRDVLEIRNFTNCRTWLFFNKYVHKTRFQFPEYVKEFQDIRSTYTYTPLCTPDS